MRIALIQPSRNRLNAAAKSWHLTKPLSLLYVEAGLKAAGFDEVELVDTEHKRYSGMDYEQILSRVVADVVGITATTYSRFDALEIAAAAKRRNPAALVVVGGVHFSHTAEDCLRNAKDIDAVVRGEGEITFPELVRAFQNGLPLDAVNGVSYRAPDGTPRHNPDRAEMVDIDKFTLAADYRPDDYPETLYGVEGDLRAFSVTSSRGCPYNCIFCAKRGSKYRTRNVDAVLDELELISSKHDIHNVNFLDLTLTASPAHLLALCQGMVKRGLKLRWWCESRASMPLELLPEMKAAGCASVSLGIESGSPEMLKRISKGITLDDVRAFCAAAAGLGISCGCMFMYSLPDETRDDILKTLEFMAELKARHGANVSIQPAMIFPGTALERTARERGVLPADFSWHQPYTDNSLNQRYGQLLNCPIYYEGKIPLEFFDGLRAHLKGLVKTLLAPPPRHWNSMPIMELVKPPRAPGDFGGAMRELRHRADASLRKALSKLT